MNRSRLRERRSASASVSAHTAKTAALARAAPRRGEGRNARAYARVTSAPPSALMKWANENAVPKCAAQAALASVEPRSQISGAPWPAGIARTVANRWSGGRPSVRKPMRSPTWSGKRATSLSAHGSGTRAGRRLGAPAEGERGAPVAPGRAPDPEVDASRVERLQHPELLGHLERAVVGEHDAARPHADPAGPGRDLGDEDLRRRVGEPGRGVMLGQPVAVVAEPVSGLGEVEGLPDRLGGGLTLPDR